ncbi:Ig domain-containing protein [Cryobacterium sp. TMB1-7]|uniref:Ig domain-containing protein n=1 Tax=Cryobacterium sp. TMB1-7 TaxID=2555866 RepID=UPI003519FD3C
MPRYGPLKHRHRQSPECHTCYTFAASGNPAPTFSVTAGALPGGLTLASTGVLAGTPTAAGESTVTVSAANGTQPSAISSIEPYS